MTAQAVYISPTHSIWTIDPTGDFKKDNVDYNRCQEACGLIPSFIHSDDESSLTKQIENRYSYFFGRWKTDGKVTMTGHWEYPDDPPLAPLMAYEHKPTSQIIYIYQYAIVAVVDLKTMTHKWARID